MAFMQEVQRISSYLSSLSVRVSREWLTGCIEYFKGEHSQYNARELEEFVRKQWELSDLRDSSEGSLPHNLHTQIKITLTGKYAVQIESVTNIAQSAYSQMQKIRKVDVVNVEATENKPESWEPRPGRMLKFMLCDGIQNILAIEYKPLHMFNEYVMPGTKILIIGPVDCRRGVFFLKAENVKVLGGEVDTLLTVNHYENVLARALRLPENPDPYSNKPSSPVTVLPTESQRTCIPSIAPMLPPPVQVSETRNTNLVGASATSRIAQQRCMQDTFANRPQPQTSADERNDLHGTGWTVDDLLAEGDDAFLEVPEETSLVSVQSCPTPASTNSTMSASIRNDRIRKNPDSIQLGNPTPNRSPPSGINLNKQATHQASSSNSNPFLASDEYLASIDMDEWENEDLDESFSVPPKPKPIIFDNRSTQVSVGPSESAFSLNNVNRNISEPQNSNWSNTMNSSLNMDEWKNEDLNENFVPLKPRTMLFDRCKNPVASNFCKNTSLQTNFNTNSSGTQNRNTNATDVLRSVQKTISREVITPAKISPMQRQPISFNSNTNMKREHSKEPDMQSPTLLTSRVTQQKSDVKLEVRKRTSFERFFDPQQQNSENQWICNSNKKASTEQIIKEEPKSVKQELIKNVSPSAVLDNEDWADAYLSSQSAGFMHPYQNLDNRSNKKSPHKVLKFSSSLLDTPKRFSTSVNSSKIDSTCSPSPLASWQTEVKVSRPEIGAADRNSFLESRSSLFPTLSSPSDIKDQFKYTKKSSNIISSLGDNISDIRLTTISADCQTASSGCNTLLSNQKCSYNTTTNTKCIIKKPAPFVYLLHIFKSTANKPCGTYRIKATIMSLLSTLTTDSSDKWSLTAKICDGTATLDVKFSSEVLDELVGLTAKELKKMKKELSKNPLLRDKIIKLFQKSRQALINLNGIFDVKFETGKMAEVLNLSEISEKDIAELRSRLKET